MQIADPTTATPAGEPYPAVHDPDRVTTVLTVGREHSVEVRPDFLSNH